MTEKHMAGTVPQGSSSYSLNTGHAGPLCLALTILIPCWLLCSVKLLAQDSAGSSFFPLLLSTDIGGWTLTQTSWYADKELYGYIDGGAELYREYGFERLATQTLTQDSHSLQIETYRMISAEAAFGMFSVSRGACREDTNLGLWSCVSARQILGCRGSYFYSIVGSDSAAHTVAAMQRVARLLTDRVREENFRLPACFENAPLRERAFLTQFLSGPLALQNARPEWEDLFKQIDRFGLFAVTWDEKEQWYSLGLYRPVDQEGLSRFIRNAGIADREVGAGWFQFQTGSTLRAIRIGSTGEILFCETDGGNPGFRGMLDAICR